MTDFENRVLEITGGPLCGIDLRTIQVNLGLRCNSNAAIVSEPI